MAESLYAITESKENALLQLPAKGTSSGDQEMEDCEGASVQSPLIVALPPSTSPKEVVQETVKTDERQKERRETEEERAARKKEERRRERRRQEEKMMQQYKEDEKRRKEQWKPVLEGNSRKGTIEKLLREHFQ